MCWRSLTYSLQTLSTEAEPVVTDGTGAAPTFVPLEELQQSADGSHSGGHVRVFAHLSPEVLHQLCPESQ